MICVNLSILGSVDLEYITCMIMTFILTMVVLLCITIVLVSEAFIFQKATQKPYKAFIPFYGDHIFNTIATNKDTAQIILIIRLALALIVYSWFPKNYISVGISLMFFPLLVLFVIIVVFIDFMPYSTDFMSNLDFMSTLSSCIIIFLPVLLSIIHKMIISKGLAHKFGKSGLFAVGLFFLPFIFYPILAFGKAKYNHMSLEE